MEISLGDQVVMRKPHPCGTNLWEVIRTGMDIRIKCLKCGKTVLFPRSQFERSVKQFVKKTRSLAG